MKLCLPGRLSDAARPLVVTILSTALLIGCGPQQKPPDDAAADPDSAGAGQTVGDSTDTPEITLQVVDADGYAAVIEKHRGKVVLVDFWATWCGHCVEQFPHTVQLRQELGDQGLAVVSVSLDDLADEADVREKLGDFGATFDNLLSQYDDSLATMKALGVEGGLPFYKIYDRKGELRYDLIELDPENPVTSDIDRHVKELLAEDA